VALLLLVSALVPVAVVPLAPKAAAAGQTTHTTTITKTYNPKGFGIDVGPATFTFTTTGFTWSQGSQSMTGSLPSVLVGTLGECTVYETPEYPGAYFSNSSAYWWPFVVDLSGVCGGYSGAVAAIMTMYVVNSTSYNQKEIVIVGSAVGSGYGGLATALNNVSMPLTFSGSGVSVCDRGDAKCGGVGAGSVSLDWANLLATSTYNNETDTVSFWAPWTCSGSGCSFVFDPLAIDGSAACTGAPCSATLTTSLSPDVIIVIEHTDNSGDLCMTPTASGLTFTQRAYEQGGDGDCVAEYYAIASSTISEAVTCEFTGGFSEECQMWGIGGANTASPFDPNVSLPCENSNGASATAPSCVVSTSDANTFIFGAATDGANEVWTAGGSFTLLSGAAGGCNHWAASGTQSRGCAEYQVVSSTQSSLSVGFTLGSPNSFWDAIADAVVAASGATVTQPIQITVAEAGAPSGTFTVSGCSVSPTTLTSDGTVYDFTASATCSLTVTAPSTTYTRYQFSDRGLPTGTWTISTCSTGTCSTASNTTYYQLENYYEATPQSPSIWDGNYYAGLTCTVVGLSFTDAEFLSLSSGGGAVMGADWCDYNLPGTLQSPVGTSLSDEWVATAPNSFTDTTGDNTHNVEYNEGTLLPQGPLQTNGGTDQSGGSYVLAAAVSIGGKMSGAGYALCSTFNAFFTCSVGHSYMNTLTVSLTLLPTVAIAVVHYLKPTLSIVPKVLLSVVHYLKPSLSIVPSVALAVAHYLKPTLTIVPTVAHGVVHAISASLSVSASVAQDVTHLLGVSISVSPLLTCLKNGGSCTAMNYVNTVIATILLNPIVATACIGVCPSPIGGATIVPSDLWLLVIPFILLALVLLIKRAKF
jgi:hypothetical protein